MDALTYLTGIALLLVLGLVSTIIANKANISHILILVLVGMIIVNLGLNVQNIFTFPPEFLVAVALLTLAMLVFDGSSRLSVRQLDQQSTSAIELTIVFIVCNIILLGLATMALFLGWNSQGFLLALIFSVVMSGTDPGSVFVMLGSTKSKVLDLLKIEAVVNTPIIVIIPFLFVDVLNGVTTIDVTSTFTDLVVPFVQQVIVGIGAGVVIGIVIFKILRLWYSDRLSPIAVIAATILGYVLAENLGGNGVLSVATIGLIFGNTFVKEKGALMEFSTIFATSLQVIVFLMIGMLVVFDQSLVYYLKSLLLFVVALFSRYVSIEISQRKSTFSVREKIFMALNMPKGIAVAVVTLAFFVLETTFGGLLQLMILFLVYSLIVSSITDRFGKFFIKKEISQDS